MKTKHRIKLVLVLAMIVYIGQSSAYSQAFCALRDPNRSIGRLFPSFTKFRSITATVSRDDVQELESLTGLKCDPREFGRHQLYAVFDEEKIIGFAQSRSELVDWGMVEIIVSTDPQGAFRGFCFQRCRSSQRKKVESETVQKLLQHRKKEDFIALLKESNLSEFQNEAGLGSESAELLHGVLLGIAKMQALMLTIWKEDIDALLSEQRKDSEN